MITLLSFISIMIIPLMITIILIHGVIKGIDIYDAFV